MRSFSPAAAATRRRLISFFLAVTLLAAPMAADDHEGEAAASAGPHWYEVMFDVVVLRPLGAVQTAVGFGFFLVAGPLSAPGGSWNEAWEVFVGTPYEETFNTKLGRF